MSKEVKTKAGLVPASMCTVLLMLRIEAIDKLML